MESGKQQRTQSASGEINLNIRNARIASVIAAGALALGGAAWAEDAAVAEDDSAAFQSDLERIAAERGVAAPEGTITTKDGMTSAVVGLSMMKMLVVRQNEDGSLSYGHAATDEEVETFIESEDTSKAAEE